MTLITLINNFKSFIIGFCENVNIIHLCLSFVSLIHIFRVYLTLSSILSTRREREIWSRCLKRRSRMFRKNWQCWRILDSRVAMAEAAVTEVEVAAADIRRARIDPWNGPCSFNNCCFCFVWKFTNMPFCWSLRSIVHQFE